MSAVHDLAGALVDAEWVPLDALAAIELVEALESIQAEGWTFVAPRPADASAGDGTHPTPDPVLHALERLAGLREVLRNAETALAKTHPAEATALMLLLNGLEDLERGEGTPDGG